MDQPYPHLVESLAREDFLGVIDPRLRTGTMVLRDCRDCDALDPTSSQSFLHPEGSAIGPRTGSRPGLKVQLNEQCTLFLPRPWRRSFGHGASGFGRHQTCLRESPSRPVSLISPSLKVSIGRRFVRNEVPGNVFLRAYDVRHIQSFPTRPTFSNGPASHHMRDVAEQLPHRQGDARMVLMARARVTNIVRVNLRLCIGLINF